MAFYSLGATFIIAILTGQSWICWISTAFWTRFYPTCRTCREGPGDSSVANRKHSKAYFTVQKRLQNHLKSDARSHVSKKSEERVMRRFPVFLPVFISVTCLLFFLWDWPFIHFLACKKYIPESVCTRECAHTHNHKSVWSPEHILLVLRKQLQWLKMTSNTGFWHSKYCYIFIKHLLRPHTNVEDNKQTEAPSEGTGRVTSLQSLTFKK